MGGVARRSVHISVLLRWEELRRGIAGLGLRARHPVRVCVACMVIGVWRQGCTAVSGHLCAPSCARDRCCCMGLWPGLSWAVAECVLDMGAWLSTMVMLGECARTRACVVRRTVLEWVVAMEVRKRLVNIKFWWCVISLEKIAV